MQMDFEGEEGARACFNVSAGAFEQRNIRQSSRGFSAASRRARKNAESAWLLTLNQKLQNRINLHLALGGGFNST